MTHSKVTEGSRCQGKLSFGVAKYQVREKVTSHDLCTSPERAPGTAWEMHGYRVQIKHSIPARNIELVITSSESEIWP